MVVCSESSHLISPLCSFRKKRTGYDYCDEDEPQRTFQSFLSNSTATTKNKKAFVPLYTQQYGLALDAPSRYANHIAVGFNHHSGKVLGEYMESMLTPNACMIHRLYGATDDSTGRARNRFGNFTMIEFNPVSQFYDVMQQCYDMTPDIMFTLMDFQSMNTRKGTVINFSWTQRGTIVEQDSQVVVKAKTSDVIYEESETLKARGFDSEFHHDGDAMKEGHYYEEEAAALVAELGLIEPSTISIAPPQNEGEEIDVMEDERLAEKIALNTKELYIKGVISLTLDAQGKVSLMEFFYEHLT